MASYDSIERICIFNSAYRLHTISFCRDDNETKVAGMLSIDMRRYQRHVTQQFGVHESMISLYL